MIKDRLYALKTKAGISCAEWSNLSTVPEATIRKILSGETPDPRFETVVKLVTSVGGTMDDIVGAKKEAEIGNSAVLVLKEAYETRIEALRERIADLKERNEAAEKDKRKLIWISVGLTLVIAGLFALDIVTGSHSWM